RRGQVVPPKVPGGPILSADERIDPRIHLARWVTAPDNPWFARALANRLWKHLMGVGLVEPVDDLRASNVSSNARLLDARAAGLVKLRFAPRSLLREICRSQTYQLAWVVPPGGQQDKRFYSRYYPKRLSAEQYLDALMDVTELPVKFPGLPLGTRAHQLP